MKIAALLFLLVISFSTTQAQSLSKTTEWLKKNLTKENNRHEVGSCEEGSEYGGDIAGFTFKATETDLTVTFSKGQVTNFKWSEIVRVTGGPGSQTSKPGVLIHLKQPCNTASWTKFRHLKLYLLTYLDGDLAEDLIKYILRIAKLNGAVIEE